MKKKLVYIALVTVIILTICLVVVEYHFRNEKKSAITGEKCRSSHLILHHALVASSHCTQSLEGRKIDYSINSFGMRDREYTAQKPEGTFRILMLGDSFTEGGGVEITESFNKIVEKKLQEKYPDKKIEVMNAGVGSYSPALEYNFLMEIGLKFNPDLVILNYDQTDLSDDANYEGWLQQIRPETNLQTLKARDWGGEIVDRLISAQATIEKNYNPERSVTSLLETPKNPALILPIMTGLQQFLLNHLESYKVLVKSILAQRGTPGIYFVESEGNQVLAQTIPGVLLADPLIHSRDFDLPDFDKWFALSEKNLLLISDVLKEKNIPFLITAYPIGIQVNGEEWGEGRGTHFFEKGKTYTSRIFGSLERFGENREIKVFSLLEEFKNSSQKPLFYNYDGHFTSLGHQVMGEGLYKYLESSGLVVFDNP